MTQRIADIATAHYRKALAAEKPVVEVPQWVGEDGKPVRLAFRRPSMEIHNRILQVTQEDGTAAGIVEALICRAVDPDTGKKVFAKAERRELMEFTDPDVLFEIFNKLKDLEEQITVEGTEQD